MYSEHFPAQLSRPSPQFHGIFLDHDISSFCFHCSDGPRANAWFPAFHSSHAVSACSLALGRKRTPLGGQSLSLSPLLIADAMTRVSEGPGLCPVLPAVYLLHFYPYLAHVGPSLTLPRWWLSGILADLFLSVTLILPSWTPWLVSLFRIFWEHGELILLPNNRKDGMQQLKGFFSFFWFPVKAPSPGIETHICLWGYY